jgi:agmatinase
MSFNTPSYQNPWAGMQLADNDADVGILGVPWDNAASYRRGAAEAPANLRRCIACADPFSEEGIPLTLSLCDYGDVPRDLDWARFFANVTARAKVALGHRFTLFLGGDHSVSIPLMQAMSESVTEPFGVLHIDAHADLEESYEGSPWSHACTARRALDLPNVRSDGYVFVGLRAPIDEDMHFLRAHPEIQVHPMRAIIQRGIPAVAADVIAYLRRFPQVYITWDVDSLDPAYAPGTGTPNAGGLTTRELLAFFRTVVPALPVRALDVVEIAPPLDHADMTTWAAIKIIMETLSMVQAKGVAAT